MPLTFSQAIIRLGRAVQRDDLAPDYGTFINEALREIQNQRNWTFMKDTVAVALPAVAVNLVPSDSVYDGINPFVVNGLVVGRTYTWTQGANDGAILFNGPSQVGPGEFIAESINVALTGTGAVTASIMAVSPVPLPSNFKCLQKKSSVFFVTDDGGFIPAEVVTKSQQRKRVWVFWGTPIITWPPRVYIECQATRSVIGMVEPTTSDFNLSVDFFGYLPDLSGEDDQSPFLDAFPNMVLAKAKAIAFNGINDTISAQSELEFDGKFLTASREDNHSDVMGRETHM